MAPGWQGKPAEATKEPPLCSTAAMMGCTHVVGTAANTGHSSSWTLLPNHKQAEVQAQNTLSCINLTKRHHLHTLPPLSLARYLLCCSSALLPPARQSALHKPFQYVVAIIKPRGKGAAAADQQQQFSSTIWSCCCLDPICKEAAPAGGPGRIVTTSVTWGLQPQQQPSHASE